MNNNDWLIHLKTLIAKYPYTAIDADIASLTLVELWGFYCFLSRLAES